MPKVSVIIPCYNQGDYIHDAVKSLLAQTYKDFEIVIVDDGSTDARTTAALKDINFSLAKVIHTKNQGLASARNTGIQASLGEYILPLDADDRIGPTYIEQAVCVLDNHPRVGIVYCDAEFFGGKAKKWDLPEFSVEEMLIENIIFCTGMFRRTDWQKVGGYDPGMRYGWEDYDFWLSLLEVGVLVHKIQQVLFFYRINEGSMLRSTAPSRKALMFKRIYRKHRNLYKKHIGICIRKVLGFQSGETGSIDHSVCSSSMIDARTVADIKKCSYQDGRFAQRLLREKPGILLRDARIYFRRTNRPFFSNTLILITLLWKRLYFFSLVLLSHLSRQDISP